MIGKVPPVDLSAGPLGLRMDVYFLAGEGVGWIGCWVIFPEVFRALDLFTASVDWLTAGLGGYFLLVSCDFYLFSAGGAGRRRGGGGPPPNSISSRFFSKLPLFLLASIPMWVVKYLRIRQVFWLHLRHRLYGVLYVLLRFAWYILIKIIESKQTDSLKLSFLVECNIQYSKGIGMKSQLGWENDICGFNKKAVDIYHEIWLKRRLFFFLGYWQELVDPSLYAIWT